jgi:Mn2+/Fe2+ NRAMP family transporter
MLVLLLANAGTIVSEFAGVAAAMDLFGISKYISVPVAAAGIWWLVTRGNYARVEKVFLAMTFAFFAYIAAAILAKPDWGEVVHSIFSPTLHLDSQYIFLLVALIGTTITPYMQLFVQSSVVEKGVNVANYADTRIDVVVGSIFANVVVIFIQIATAATLHVQGIQVESAEDAARALIPIAGPYAFALFGLGLLGASILAAGVLPLATAFAICEAFGFEKGVTRDFEEAREFYTLFTGLIIIGALVTLIPGLSLLQLLLVVQVANGILLPFILVFVTLLAGDKELLHGHANGRFVQGLAWATTIIVGTLAVVFLVISFVLPLFGVNL